MNSENFTDTYTTRLGTEFKFRFEVKESNYEIFIVEQPAYGNRDNNLHTTHRLKVGDQFKVCWDGSLQTPAEAKLIAGLWSDMTERYIMTGEQFPSTT